MDLEFSLDDIQIAPKKPAIYIRVSTAEQNTASQQQQLLKWLIGYFSVPPHEVELMRDDPDELKRWMTSVATWYVDQGESGDTLDRPQFATMQDAIVAGEHDTVIVWKIDRLSRKITDGLNVLSDWLDRGVHFVSITQQIDLKGAMGKMIAALLLGVAEMEQQTRRERQAAGIAAAKEAGTYKRVARKAAEKRTARSKRRAARAMELKAQGFKPEEIANAMGASLTTVYRYFKTAESESESDSESDSE